jgi:hypothetical protein
MNFNFRVMSEAVASFVMAGQCRMTGMTNSKGLLKGEAETNAWSNNRRHIGSVMNGQYKDKRI